MWCKLLFSYVAAFSKHEFFSVWHEFRMTYDNTSKRQRARGLYVFIFARLVKNGTHKTIWICYMPSFTYSIYLNEVVWLIMSCKVLYLSLFDIHGVTSYRYLNQYTYKIILKLFPLFLPWLFLVPQYSLISHLETNNYL